MSRGAAAPADGMAQGYALALAGAIAFSGKAVVAKLLYRHGIDATAAVGLRMLLAWPPYVALAWWAGRGKAPLAARDHLLVLALGFTGYYLASVLDFAGLQYISASLERLILFVYPTIVALLVAHRARRRLSRRQALALAVSYAGVLLAFGHEALGALDAGTTGVLRGGALVLGSAAAYAVYLVLGGEAVGRLGALRLTALASNVACALCVGQFCLLRPWSDWGSFPAAVWELSALNAVACTVLPTWLVMRAIALIGPAHASQVGMVGPVSTLLLAVWILDEPLTAPMLAGTALVLLGVGLIARPAPAAPVTLEEAS